MASNSGQLNSMANHDKSGFVPSRLPWIISAGALVLYLLTLNRWVTLSSLPIVSDLAAKELAPPINQPLRFLILMAFHGLPVGWQPLALNALSALCAAWTLGLLARSVMLLPHDRTRDQ